MKERIVVVPKDLEPRLDGKFEVKETLDSQVRQELLSEGWIENLEDYATGSRVVWSPPEGAILRDEEETASEESEDHHEEILTMAEVNRRRREEVEEAERMAAHLAHRDQNDADVQEIARQVGVFCRGLDEAGVVHPRFGNNQNQDRINALQIFVITEVGRLRSKQDAEEG